MNFKRSIGSGRAGGGRSVTGNDDDGPRLIAEWADDSDIVLVAFGGHGTAERFRNFFRYARTITKRAAGEQPISMLFLTDSDRSWYHHGVRGIAANIDELADWLAGLFEQHGCRRIVFIGLSSGGYAALLLGWLLNVDTVHALGSTTFIDKENRIRYGDGRDFDLIEGLARTGQAEYLDLRRLFAAGPSPKTEFHLHFSGEHKWDGLHASRLSNIPNVYLHSLDERAHSVGRSLHDLGELEKLLAKALQSDA